MPLSYRELLNQLRAQTKEVTPLEVQQRRAASEGAPPEFVLIDVRERDEVTNEGQLPGSIHIPRGFLESRIEQHVPDRNTPIVAYCAGGNRSVLAAETLLRMGYSNVASMAGGFGRWRNEGFPIFQKRFLNAEERRRYSRHLLIPEVGDDGQGRLLASKVLMVGAGGLGCPAGYYLAAAGVGTLGIIDFDVVDESNLQRQILHSVERVGMPKVESAKKTLNGLNPGIKVVTYNDRLSRENIEELVKEYDVIVDGSDNFATRYLVNDACVKYGKPNVHGSVYRFEGQVTVFDPRKGPCYRCLYPEPPTSDMAPSCAEAGVLGVLPGVVGLLEAVETIKVILGIGQPLIGRLVHYDALRSEFRELRLRKDPTCAYCNGGPFPGFVDYEVFCANPGLTAPA